VDPTWERGASGAMPGMKTMPFGNRPNGIYIFPAFPQSENETKNSGAEYGYQAAGSREGWSGGMHMSGSARSFKNSTEEARQCACGHRGIR